VLVAVAVADPLLVEGVLDELNSSTPAFSICRLVVTSSPLTITPGGAQRSRPQASAFSYVPSKA